MSEDRPIWPMRPPPKPRGGKRGPARREPVDAPREAPTPATPARAERREELRIFGLNACLAAFAARPQDLRKVYLDANRMTAMREVMAFCVRNRLGYRVVEDGDLLKLTGSQHHEGVCFDMRRPGELSLETLLSRLPASQPACLLWLDGVGNPHNFGALLRSSAHFGVAGVLLPEDSPLALSGAACRVAEGGAEAVPLVRLGESVHAMRALQQAGFTLAATLPGRGHSLFEAAIPARTVFVMGAEREGMRPELVEQCDLHLTIPGTGHVESLNIASAVAALLAVHALRQQTAQ